MSEVIRQRRQELGFSQAELAKLASLKARTPNSALRSRRCPAFVARAKALARALEVTLDVLAGGVAVNEIQGDWWMAWWALDDREDPKLQAVEIRPRGLDLELVLRGAPAHTNCSPQVGVSSSASLVRPAMSAGSRRQGLPGRSPSIITSTPWSEDGPPCLPTLEGLRVRGNGARLWSGPGRHARVRRRKHACVRFKNQSLPGYCSGAPARSGRRRPC